ncbi:iron-sulfur cluster assembly scaffold protein [Fodinicurvata sp. EGI_FJ10296]|uniref:iron-sulfur cluster assembly scaffold protein n=1 Tax=Fodinicurvata sp. EGI_FJ10296 TaxID=3231908 RepID=UPI003453AF53
MMADEIYQETLIARAKSGRERNRLPEPDATVTLDNPLCGDRVTIDVSVDEGVVTAVGHEVRGCMLCEATAAMIAAYAVGGNVDSIHAHADAVRKMIKEGTPAPGSWPDTAALGPVHGTKSRHNCVLLPFDALTDAIAQATRTPASPPSTENASPF